MANVLNKDKQIAVIGALAEGSSIRSIERIAGIHRDTIMRLGVRAGTHVESVPVKETHQGQTVWEGVVEAFELSGHPKATHAYAWISETEDQLKRYVAILKIPPVVSPIAAVRAAIVQEYKLGTAEET